MHFDGRNTVRDDNRGQAGTVSEGSVVYRSNTVRNGDGGQAGAAMKCSDSNRSNTVRNGYRGQAGAIVKQPIFYGGNFTWERDRSQA